MKIGSPEWEHLIDEGARRLGVHLCPDALRRFGVHAGELLKWNRKINLTAITDPVEIAVKHVVDSLAPAGMIPPNARLLDLGSGGGFPGVPLSIALPGLSVTLLDASRKKVSFLKHIIRRLRLENAEAVQMRAEELPRHSQYLNAFDLIVSRAVSPLQELIHLAVPLAKTKGALIAYRGAGNTQDCKPAAPAGNDGPAFAIEVKPYRLPIGDRPRRLVIVRFAEIDSR
jgi:16S rRNA (guanine527-N7)-methyltransferase